MVAKPGEYSEWTTTWATGLVVKITDTQRQLLDAEKKKMIKMVSQRHEKLLLHNETTGSIELLAATKTSRGSRCKENPTIRPDIITEVGAAVDLAAENTTVDLNEVLHLHQEGTCYARLPREQVHQEQDQKNGGTTGPGALGPMTASTYTLSESGAISTDTSRMG